ncbi:cytochrome b5-like heme/steroid binding domain-containing protein [Abortiporus biennis]|nr:cytochrome b5-like heme/steroid binding domain-containing protein [Abortiporus biennis]
MSWLLNPQGDQPKRRKPSSIPIPESQDGGASNTTSKDESLPGSPWTAFPLKDDYPKVPDPSEKDRLVSTKQANRPFLAYSEYREKREQEHEAWVKRQKEREEKLARGEDVGPEEPDPTEEPEVGCLGLLKFILYFVIFVILAGKFFTGSFLWEHELPNFKQLIPTNQRLFSEQMLARFDGSVDGRPIYLAIDGDVYDVSEGRLTYGPGGSYHWMAGKDAARAFATGCFSTHQTHDIRGLTEKEMQGLQHWKKFYADSKKYPKVGRVSHPPIDPLSPIPEHCNAKKEQEKEKEKEKAGNTKAKTQSSGSAKEKHVEL